MSELNKLATYVYTSIIPICVVFDFQDYAKTGNKLYLLLAILWIIVFVIRGIRFIYYTKFEDK